METIVIYKSISGFTEKYAKWIAEELKADILDQNRINRKILDKYEMVIYGGSLHAVGITGLKKVKKILKKLDNKELVVFATGASPYKEGIIEEIKKHNFGEEKVKLFYLRGGFDFKKLNLINKIIMFIFIHIIKLKSEKSRDEEGMISAYENPVDFTKKESINDLVEYVRRVSNGP